jgi:uncharacterized protein (DUF2141 family)
MFLNRQTKAQHKRSARPVAVCTGLLLTLMLWMSGCASPGNPDGGPYDETPPRVTGSSPAYASVNAKNRKIEIFFDEYVKINNASENVIVSPPQLNAPEITALGKKIKVNLLDSLIPNTTYTIDFSDAIVDNNEGNPLGNYSFVFSTGDAVDTMEVSGTVLNAQNLEPVKGILVGLHSNLSDTAFTRTPLLRVARTNGSGHFIIKGVKPGTYKAYALQDADGDFRYGQKSEMLAFMDNTFTTSSYPDARPDTVWHDYARTRVDSIRMVHFTHYKPDDLVLLAYLASGQERHLLKTVREVPEHFEIYFTAPDTETPRLRGLNFNTDGKLLLERSAGNDTLQYWFTDTTLAYKDTLRAELAYNETDTTGVLRLRTDTLELVSKVSRAKQLKWEANAEKDWQKQQEKLKKRNLPYLTQMPPTPLEMNIDAGTSLDPNENIGFRLQEPLARVDTGKIHLYVRRDSVFVPADFLFQKDRLSLLKYTLLGEWRPLQDYRLLVDSAALTGIYGHVNNPAKISFNIPSLDRYSSLFLNLIGVSDTMAVVQLLRGDKPVSTVRSKKGHADFYFIKPGNYYLRLFIDRNGNGQWDPGDYEKHLQPEETYYYPTKLELRAMWDVSQDWDIHAVPLTQQKPMAITKQKPDKAKTIQHRNAEREKNKH